ncbi:MAG TPA: hypothetical protein ENJ56_08055, partial [Anaerolineae bacterium]|nr:hypothetical protein [Anaerolineae bacterium]
MSIKTSLTSYRSQLVPNLVPTCVNLGTIAYNVTMYPLKLALLGSFQATWKQNPLTNFRSDKIRALLAYLAVESDQPHRREQLAVLLWPESAYGMRNLRKSLFRLRQTLDNYQVGLSDALLTITRQTVTLKKSALTLDSVQFEQLLAHVAAHTHHALFSCVSCLEKLEEGVALYRGDFLSGFSLPDCNGFEEWLLFKR